MQDRLLKEFRCLLFPFLIAVGAALPMAARMGFDRPLLDSVEPLALRLLLEIAPSLFYVGLAMAAAMSYGVEFQNRTLPLLLSQPSSRFSLWCEKIAVLMAGVILAAATYTVATGVLASFSSFQLGSPRRAADFFTNAVLLGGTFVLATVCSAGFWTLLARSTIGGMALGAASQCTVMLCVTDLVGCVYGADLSFDDSRNVEALVCAGLLYAAVFLWLGWRQFARFQLKFGMTGEVSARPESFAGIKLDLPWLRCRPTGSTLNLIRKEVRLNKSVFLVAAVFSICWVLAALLMLFVPRGHSTFVMMLNVLTVIYVPALFLLAGCASLGEEKSLGLHAWQLTLPIGPFRQWLLKLVTSFGIGMLLGVALPLLLSCITAFEADTGLYALTHVKGDVGIRFVCISGAAILLVSFWAATLFNGTLAAALVTIVAFPVFGCCLMVARACTPLISGPLEFLLSWLIAVFQLSPDYWWRDPWLASVYFLSIQGIVLLIESFVQFRRIQIQGWRTLRSALILVVIALLFSLAQAGFGDAARSVYDRGVRHELQSALLALPRSELPPVGGLQSIDFKKLEATGHLSELGKKWLRKTSISVLAMRPSRHGRLSYLVTVVFPDGRSDQAYVEASASEEK